MYATRGKASWLASMRRIIDGFGRLLSLYFIFAVVAIKLDSVAATASSVLEDVGRSPFPGAVQVDNTEDAFVILASAISERMLSMQKSGSPGKEIVKQLDADHVEKVARSLRSMASAQGTLKSLDGAAHEAYQRTHKGSKSFTDADEKVSGRTTRTALRAGCVADALFACELCELLEYPELLSEQYALSDDGCLNGREILLNTTIELSLEGSLVTNTGEDPPTLSILVIYDPSYNGGAGISHGGIDDLVDTEEDNRDRGRILVVLDDDLSDNLEETLRYLDASPHKIVMKNGLGNEDAYVHKGLWKTSSGLLQSVKPILESHGSNRNATSTAIHFVGRSLAGAVAGLSAAILDGTIPISKVNPIGRNSLATTTTTRSNLKKTSSTQTDKKLSGLARGRASAMCLGPCPCLSPNVRVSFVTSCIYGDDAVARATKRSLDKLCNRANRHIKGNVIGKRMGWMTDTVSLTFSSLQTHVVGSEGKEGKLSLPGRGYLVRPRRLGGLCSIHEIGGVTGRESIRAAVLWQLGDILLSKSLWRHHSLYSYIHGLDRVQLRSMEQSEDSSSLE